MKNFSELLATEQTITIRVTCDGETVESSHGLLDPISITVNKDHDTKIESILIDDFELIPGYNHLLPNSSPFVSAGVTWKFQIEEPFYQWKHLITHQGWLFYQNAK